MLATEAKLESVDASVEVSQGALEISRADEAKVYVDFPENKPLSQRETHARIRVIGDHVESEIELDAEQLDRLADAIYHIQDELQGGVR